jgi:hypothetical protein
MIVTLQAFLEPLSSAPLVGLAGFQSLDERKPLLSYVPGVKCNCVIQQFSPTTTNPTLGHAVLPRAPDGSRHARNFHLESRLVLPVHTLRRDQDEELGSKLIGKSIAQLLADPGTSRMTSYIKVEDVATVLPNNGVA